MPPRYGTNSNPRAVLLLLGMLAASAGAAVLFFFNPSQNGFYPFCLFHKATGLLCPGCGSLRATHQLLHGHVLAAVHCNALLVLALPVGAGFALKRFSDQRRSSPKPLVIRPLWLWCGFAVMVLFCVFRNLPLGQFLRP